MVSAVLVADEGKTIQVMDPDTYESVTIKGRSSWAQNLAAR